MESLVYGTLLAVGYGAVLLLISRLFGVKYTEILTNNKTILKGIVAPVAISSVLLVLFLYGINLLSASFTVPPIEPRWFMWGAPIIIFAGIIARIPQFNREKFSTKTLLITAFAVLLVGFSEELLMRGAFVAFLQNGGFTAFGMILFSSIVFGLLHGINFFNGQDGKTTGTQILFTTLIGANFFAVMIVSGHIWVAMLAHALHDLSALSSSDQVNKSSQKPSRISMTVGVLTYFIGLGMLVGFIFI